MIPLRHIYRRLLRAAGAATRFSRPATRSVRQLLRSDIERVARDAGGLGAALDERSVEHAERTMALYLFSSLHYRPVHGPEKDGDARWQPQCDSRTTYVAHALVKNMASLAYHHLSPNTAMQSARAGGSRVDNVPHKRTVLEHALAFEDGVAAVDADTAGASSVLYVTPKPVRGPVGKRPRMWDGQQPEKTMPQNETHTFYTLNNYVDELGRAYAAARARDPNDPSIDALRKRLVDARGTLKGLRKKNDKQLAEHELAQRPIRAMDAVVQLACANESLWLGAGRWGKLRRGEFLPP